MRLDKMRRGERVGVWVYLKLPGSHAILYFLFCALLLFGGYQADSCLELKKGSYGRRLLTLRGGLSLLVTRNDRGFPGPGRERTGTIRRR